MAGGECGTMRIRDAVKKKKKSEVSHVMPGSTHHLGIVVCAFGEMERPSKVSTFSLSTSLMK